MNHIVDVPMSQYVNEIEDELRELDICDDLGTEDSDITPTNSPYTSSALIDDYSRSNQIQDVPSHANFSRKWSFADSLFGYPRSIHADEFDNRSNSSLSWGEDEYEGEATRRVNVLFDQLDAELYRDSPFVAPLSLHSDDFDDHQDSSQSPIVLLPVTEVDHDTNEINLPKELAIECVDWVQEFPHLRARGHKINVELLNTKIDKTKTIPGNEIEDDVIAVIASHGEIYDTLVDLPFGCYSNVSRSTGIKLNNHGSKAKVASRVCSGSNDPEVLKEQVLAAMFDAVWQRVARLATPLLQAYAANAIQQSAEWTSFSRESSGRVEFPACLSATPRALVPNPSAIPRPFASAMPFGRGDPGDIWRRRPISAANRLPNALPPRVGGNVVKTEELLDLLSVTSKPIQINSARQSRREVTSRSFSVMEGTLRSSTGKGNTERSSSITLPSVVTPNLMTRKQNGMTSAGIDKRPASTSSCNVRSRRRFQDQFRQLKKPGTIEEGDANGLEEDGSRLKSRSLNRLGPFLPPIVDGNYESKINDKSNANWRANTPMCRRSSSGDRKSFGKVMEIFLCKQKALQIGISEQPIKGEHLSVTGVPMKALRREGKKGGMIHQSTGKGNDTFRK